MSFAPLVRSAELPRDCANLDIDETAAMLRDMQAADYIFYVVRGEKAGDHAFYLERALARIRLLLDGLRAR